jgi:hypothetical protein
MNDLKYYEHARFLLHALTFWIDPLKFCLALPSIFAFGTRSLVPENSLLLYPGSSPEHAS